MERIVISTNRIKEIVDITDKVQRVISDRKMKEGLCHLFILHTTASLTLADLDPGTDKDMLDAFEKMVSKLRYRHMHNPEHVPDHIMSSIIGADVIVPIENKELVLGTWQRIVLVELDGPRDRTINITFIKSHE